MGGAVFILLASKKAIVVNIVRFIDFKQTDFPNIYN